MAESSNGLSFVLGIVSWGVIYTIVVSTIKEPSKSIRENNKLKDDFFAEGIVEFSQGLFGGIIGRGLPLFMVAVSAPLMALILVLSGISTLRMLIGIEILDFAVLFGFVVSILFFRYHLRMLIGFVNLSTKFRVIRDGLMMQVFNWRFRWIFIAWKDIEDVKKWYPNHLNGQYYWVVEIGETYQRGSIHMGNVLGIFPSGVYISPLIRNRDRLAEIIKERIS